MYRVSRRNDHHAHPRTPELGGHASLAQGRRAGCHPRRPFALVAPPNTDTTHPFGPNTPPPRLPLPQDRDGWDQAASSTGFFGIGPDDVSSCAGGCRKMTESRTPRRRNPVLSASHQYLSLPSRCIMHSRSQRTFLGFHCHVRRVGARGPGLSRLAVSHSAESLLSQAERRQKEATKSKNNNNVANACSKSNAWAVWCLVTEVATSH